jgi:hypothetical protein
MNKFKGSHHETKVAIISLTDFYRELTAAERLVFESGKFNLDHPSKHGGRAVRAVCFTDTLSPVILKMCLTLTCWRPP